MRHLIVFLNIFLFIFTLLSNNITTISEVSFYVLSAMIVLDYFSKKSLSLFQVWSLAFIFIILSEALLIQSDFRTVKAVKFLLIANNLVVFGYYVPLRFKKIRQSKIYTNRVKASKQTPSVFIMLLIAYLAYSIPNAILTYRLGRNAAADLYFDDRNLLLGVLFSSLSLVLPSIIAFYYKEIKKKESAIIPFMMSLPIFLILFIGGTRFPLLFSFGGFLIISQSNVSGGIKLNMKLFAFALLLVGSSFLMGEFRGGGLSSGISTKSSETEPYERVSQKIASKMSPEGTVDMTALMMTYFDSHPHTYGQSILFLTYFWVPRAIWPDKPTMLGHWLIREYRTGFGEGHSSSFGFTGELYADFGYFSLFFVFLIGIALNWADRFREFHLSQPKSYQKILVGMMFSYVFFFVRSPITSTMSFLGILLVYFLIRKFLFTKTLIYNKQITKKPLLKNQAVK